MPVLFSYNSMGTIWMTSNPVLIEGLNIWRDNFDLGINLGCLGFPWNNVASPDGKTVRKTLLALTPAPCTDASDYTWKLPHFLFLSLSLMH